MDSRRRTLSNSIERGSRLRNATPAKQQEQDVTSKPKLSSLQQLEILEKLRKGQFKRGVGLSQFYPTTEPNASSRQEFRGSKKNLLSEFNKLVDSTAPDLATEGPKFSSTILSEGNRDDADLPRYIKILEKFTILYCSYARGMDQMADLKARAVFYSMLEEKRMRNVIMNLEKSTNVITKYLQKPIMDQCQIFQLGRTAVIQQSASNKITVDLEHQNSFFECFGEIKKLQERIQALKIDADMERQIKKLLELSNLLGKTLYNISEKDVRAKETSGKITAIVDPDSSGCYTDSEHDQTSLTSSPL